MDAPGYVADFRGADPVWNVTGSGGTNANCLAAYAEADSLRDVFLASGADADLTSWLAARERAEELRRAEFEREVPNPFGGRDGR